MKGCARRSRGWIPRKRELRFTIGARTRRRWESSANPSCGGDVPLGSCPEGCGTKFPGWEVDWLIPREGVRLLANDRYIPPPQGRGMNQCHRTWGSAGSIPHGGKIESMSHCIWSIPGQSQGSSARSAQTQSGSQADPLWRDSGSRSRAPRGQSLDEGNRVPLLCGVLNERSIPFRGQCGVCPPGRFRWTIPHREGFCALAGPWGRVYPSS